MNPELKSLLKAGEEANIQWKESQFLNINEAEIGKRYLIFRRKDNEDLESFSRYFLDSKKLNIRQSECDFLNIALVMYEYFNSCVFVGPELATRTWFVNIAQLYGYKLRQIDGMFEDQRKGNFEEILGKAIKLLFDNDPKFFERLVDQAVNHIESCKEQWQKEIFTRIIFLIKAIHQEYSDEESKKPYYGEVDETFYKYGYWADIEEDDVEEWVKNEYWPKLQKVLKEKFGVESKMKLNGCVYIQPKDKCITDKTLDLITKQENILFFRKDVDPKIKQKFEKKGK